MTSEDGDLHAHCTRPVYEVNVRTGADKVVLKALNDTVEQLCEKALRATQEQQTAGSDYHAGLHYAYESAARLLDENLRAALAQYGEVRKRDPE